MAEFIDSPQFFPVYRFCATSYWGRISAKRFVSYLSQGYDPLRVVVAQPQVWQTNFKTVATCSVVRHAIV